MTKKRILVAPLNWGLGHAARCIPVIEELQKQDFQPVIASDGAAFELLRKEFPLLEYYQLPSYNIRYSKTRQFFLLKLLLQAPSIARTILAEKQISENLIREKNIAGIISDNRWGVRSASVPSVLITHQVNVLAGFLTKLSSWVHRKLIRKFDQCWVPDVPESPSLSGRMGHTAYRGLNIRYLGLLSRFQKQPMSRQYDIAIILSGPEPQRSMLEKILVREFRNYPGKTLLVKGVVDEFHSREEVGNMVIYNYLTAGELRSKILSSGVVLCRPGYSSIMDLAALEKKAFFIPTPGQPEQEYLAEKMEREKMAPHCEQELFVIEELDRLDHYKGLTGFSTWNGLSDALTLFKGK